MNFTEIVEELRKAVNRRPSPYDTTAEVMRIEGDTAWVQIPGSEDETPVNLTIAAKEGDTVQVRVSGGTAFLVGNATAPPTDDTTAIEANIKSVEAELAALQAKEAADAALLKANETAAEFASAVITINGDIEDLQSQIDGNITTWFYGYAPTTANVPASSWTTTDEKNNHLGDLFYDTTTGYAYRWMLEGSTYSWSRITDTDVTAALANAQAAQDTADGKRRVFVTTPTPPYDVGDLWCEGASGDIKTCTTSKASSQSYSSSDWSKLNKYTDDTLANQAKTAAERAEGYANAAQASANNANTYASQALGHLSTVQSVAETLTWITQHGRMDQTSDQAIDPTHVYFVVDANGDYVVGNTHYSLVTEPDADNLSTYYELSIDESLNNYVGTHLALTNEGLWLLPVTTGTYKVLVSVGASGSSYAAGTYIIDSSGATVAMFGPTVRIGKSNGENITVGSSKISLNAIDGSTALKVGFEPTTASGTTRYGARITDNNNQSFINITPATSGSSFTNKLELSCSNMATYNFGIPDGGYISFDDDAFDVVFPNDSYLQLNPYQGATGGLSLINANSNSVFYVDWDGNVTANNLIIVDSVDDLNDAPANSICKYDSSADHRPPIAAGGTVITTQYSSSYKMQMAFPNDSTASNRPRIYLRRYSSGWATSWYQVRFYRNSVPTFTTPSITSSRAKDVTGGYYKDGDQVYVQLGGKCNQAHAGGSRSGIQYFNGLPTPAATSRVALSVVWAAHQGVVANITSNGNLMICPDENLALAVDDEFYITGTYFTSD